MKDLHEDYLMFIRDYATFYCRKKSYIKVVLKTSNEEINKRNYCIRCMTQFELIRENFNYIDIKYVCYKQEHCVKMCLNRMLTAEELEKECVKCDNCESNIRKTNCLSNGRCTGCFKKIDDDKVLKEMINSFDFLEFPEKLTFDYFLKNQQNYFELNEYCDLHTNLFMKYEKKNLFSEIGFIQMLSEESGHKLINNEFNINKRSAKFLKHLSIYDETERKTLILSKLSDFIQYLRI